MPTEQAIQAGLAAQERGRHAVHVAGQGGCRRVVIGVGVEPQYENRPVEFLPISHDAVHRSHRQAVITTHEDRNRAGASELKSALAERANPAFDVVIIFGICRRQTVRGFGG